MNVRNAILPVTFATALAVAGPAAAASKTATVTVHGSVVRHCAVVTPPNGNGGSNVNCGQNGKSPSSAGANGNAGSDVRAQIDFDSGARLSTINF